MTVKETLDELIARFGNVSATDPGALRFGINPGDSHPGPQLTHFHAVMAADFLEQRWPQALGPQDASQRHELAINDWLPFDLNLRQTGEQTFELDYPRTTEWMFQPLGERPTALVALRYPLPLQSIRLQGNQLQGVRLWVSTLHPGDPHDENEWHELKVDENGRSVLTPELASRSVAEIRFRGDVSGNDRRLRLTLIRAADATERP